MATFALDVRVSRAALPVATLARAWIIAAGVSTVWRRWLQTFPFVHGLAVMDLCNPVRVVLDHASLTQGARRARKTRPLATLGYVVQPLRG